MQIVKVSRIVFNLWAIKTKNFQSASTPPSHLIITNKITLRFFILRKYELPTSISFLVGQKRFHLEETGEVEEETQILHTVPSLQRLESNQPNHLQPLHSQTNCQSHVFWTCSTCFALPKQGIQTETAKPLSPLGIRLHPNARRATRQKTHEAFDSGGGGEFKLKNQSRLR